jgi:hypothetical protein
MWQWGRMLWLMTISTKNQEKFCSMKNQNKEILKDLPFLECDAMWNGN